MKNREGNKRMLQKKGKGKTKWEKEIKKGVYNSRQSHLCLFFPHWLSYVSITILITLKVIKDVELIKDRINLKTKINDK